MAQGLDELVEWLVGEVSFFGDGESSASFLLRHGVACILYTLHAPQTMIFDGHSCLHLI